MALSIAYWPTVDYLAAFWKRQTLTIEACEHYQKGGWRNRCMIAGPNGPLRLSIPLEKGKHQKTPIRDVKIAWHEPWNLIHWRSIQAAYGNAPFFEHFEADLHQFYQKKPVFLFDFNIELFTWLLQQTGWPGQLLFTQTYQGAPDEPPSIALPAYPQVFQERFGFLPGLSTLDLLMCTGRTYVKTLESL